MPAALEVAFKEWWQSLKSSDVITIRYHMPVMVTLGENQIPTLMQKQVEAIVRDETQSSPSDVQVFHS